MVGFFIRSAVFSDVRRGRRLYKVVDGVPYERLKYSFLPDEYSSGLTKFFDLNFLSREFGGVWGNAPNMTIIIHFHRGRIWNPPLQG